MQTRWMTQGVQTFQKASCVSRIRDGEQDGLSAATPQLEALKMVMSMTVTVVTGMKSEEKFIPGWQLHSWSIHWVFFFCDFCIFNLSYFLTQKEGQTEKKHLDQKMIRT